MRQNFTGGCACGAIRYEGSGEPLAMGHCHCRDCQHSSGTAFSSAVVMPADKLRFVQGDPQYYQSRAESGALVQRGFCPTCGSPLVFSDFSNTDYVCVKAASLDDPSWFTPQFDIWTQSAQAWAHMDPALPKFATEPEPPEDEN